MSTHNAPRVREGDSISRSGPMLVVSDRRGRGAMPSWRLALVDTFLVIGLGILCAWPLGVVYVGKRWLAAVVIGLVLGVVIAWLSARWRWGPWLTTLAAAAAYLAVGSAVAVPARARRGFLPTADSLHDLVIGLAHTWRESLTLPVPLGENGVVLIVPLVTGLVGGLVAALLLWRSRWPGLAGLVLVLVLVLAAAFGDIEADAAILRGFAVASVGLVWLRWRSVRHVRARWGRRILATTLVVGVAGGAAIGLGSLTDSNAHRVVLRDHVETPFDPRDYPSPLQKYRAYKKEPVKTQESLFTVDGLEPGTLVRLAVMDTYDGIVWNVSGGPGSPHDSGTFRRLRNDPESTAKAGVFGSITVDNYTGVWVPSVGETLSMNPVKDGRTDGDAASELVINRQTGTVAQIGGVQPGTTYEIEAVVPTPVMDEEITLLKSDEVSLPEPALVPEELMDRIQKWQVEDGFSGDAGGPLALFLRDAFRAHGFYSDGIDDYVPAGHGASRLASLAKTPNPVGNAEQYAAAMALAGQRLGLPIRVVIGFKVPPGDSAVRGENVLAWTEVKLKGAGWVPFEPTPDEDKKLRQPNDDPNEDPQPQVLQPPRVPGEPKEATDNLQQGDGRRDGLDVLEVLGTILGVLFDVSRVALLLSPLWGVLLFKFLRRRRRRKSDEPILRMTGAWRELADRMRDLGVRPQPGATRRESAYAAAEKYDAVRVVTLAHTADRHVYGEGEPTADEAGAYWSDVDTALKRIRKETSWWRRLAARFSLASVPWRAGLEGFRARVRAFGRRLWNLGPVARVRLALRRTGSRAGSAGNLRRKR